MFPWHNCVVRARTRTHINPMCLTSPWSARRKAFFIRRRCVTEDRNGRGRYNQRSFLNPNRWRSEGFRLSSEYGSCQLLVQAEATSSGHVCVSLKLVSRGGGGQRGQAGQGGQRLLGLRQRRRSLDHARSSTARERPSPRNSSPRSRNPRIGGGLGNQAAWLASSVENFVGGCRVFTRDHQKSIQYAISSPSAAAFAARFP